MVYESSSDDVFHSQFSKNIFLQKYSMDGQETWSDTCRRVVDSVTKQYLPAELRNEIYEAMLARKFIPAGRYLYSAGRDFHQVNNCFLFRATDSREGWAEAMQSATSALMSGGGIGFDYSLLREKGALIRRTGGTSTGPLALMHMVNESGRYIMQGGSRRSAIWAGLRWDHPDCPRFMVLKDWSEAQRKMKEQDMNFPLPMELTNISVIYNTEFFLAIEDPTHEKHELAKEIWKKNCTQAFSTAEPGMSFDFCKDSESLRNAPVVKDTQVLTKSGYRRVEELVNIPVTVWTGQQWAENVVFKKTKDNASIVRVEMSGGRVIRCDPEHPFIVRKYRGKGKQRRLVTKERVPAGQLSGGDIIDVSLPNEEKTDFDTDAYTLGWLYGDGSFHVAGGADLTLCSVESKTCLPYLSGYDSINKNDGRGFVRLYFGVNERFSGRSKEDYPLDGHHASFLAGLFDADGNWDSSQKRIRLSNKSPKFLHGVRRALESIGILSNVSKNGVSTYGGSQTWQLVIASDYMGRFVELVPTKRLDIDLDAYSSYRRSEVRIKSVVEDGVEDVFCADVGVPEHTFVAEGVVISNCTEVVSSDDSDKCNLGTVWLNHCEDRDDFARVCHIATAFLLCGGLYSDVPTEKIREVGNRNNRIGLGLGGIHEWLMERNYDYEVTPELHKWLSVYEMESDAASYIWSKELGVAIPKGKRSIAPTGTIGIIAETTTGIEPLFCKAYKRRYYKGEDWMYEYVVDGAVKRLIEKGIPLENIKDAYDITFKERVKFQADVQKYVDMAISSTCNLPEWGSEGNNEDTVEEKSVTLLKYAKRLRGFTCYPDGARGGQPLTRVDIEEALENEGVVYEERMHECGDGVCGI